MRQVTIYTDGACLGNPGPGGWAALLIEGDQVRELSGYEPQTTNNRMELRGAVEALRALDEPSEVDLHTDSQYVRNGMAEWLARWKRNGWRTADKKPVKNSELWQRLDEAVRRHKIDWRWVKGHAGNIDNERADELANEGMAPFKAT